MTNIALDSNIWIYLTNDNLLELWNKFKQVKEENLIRVIINDVILLEWKRNKPKTIKNLTENIKNEYKSALKLSNYLSGEVKEKYLETISQYKDETNRIAKAEAKVEEVEAFMNSCTIIPVTENQKLFVAELAINKLPPFQHNKNNYNDALIMRNICEFVENTIPFLYDLIYVSNNPEDFIDKQTEKVYESLFEGLAPIRLKTVTELGEALKLAPELFEDFEEWLDDQLENEAERYSDLMRGK
ncbi:MAG: PIN domain-containing protein [Bacteroidia bacterium]|nr:PIN domain-containing protein [Bacteroidia bacterium]